jgi:hypothetical protein
MKRTAGGIVGSRFPERDVALNDIGDIHPIEQFLNE